MDYTEVADVLRDDAAGCDITAFPDGSIDMRYSVTDSTGGRLAREEFGEQIASGESESFSLNQEEVAMGGQAVNMARQAHKLGDTVRLYGHLDHSMFDSLAFETVSMGEPATVYVYDFDSEVMLADTPDAMSEWSLDTLREAMGDSFEDRMTADAICCANWISFDGMTAALSDLGEQSLNGNYFVLDPGDLTTKSHEAVATLCTVLAALEQSYDVVLSTDDDEMAYLAEALAVEVDSDDTATILRRLGDELAITGIVLHGASEAIAATPNGVNTVPNIRVNDTETLTGAGDRFGAGLAHGLVESGDWEQALLLGNLCASYHVEQGGTGSRETLAAYANRA